MALATRSGTFQPFPLRVFPQFEQHLFHQRLESGVVGFLGRNGVGVFGLFETLGVLSTVLAVGLMSIAVDSCDALDAVVVEQWGRCFD